MNETHLEIDHVVIAVTDLEASAKDFDLRFGLTATEGGRHPSWGTANRIIPLGATFLELVTVVDGAQAAVSAFGRLILKAMTSSGRLCGWAVRTDGLERIAERLNLEVANGSRLRGDGSELRWRIAGIDRVATDLELPFFIEWASYMDQPSLAPVAHRAGDVRLQEITLSGDADRLHVWLGTRDLPISVVPGHLGVVSITLASDQGGFVLSQARLDHAE